MGEYGLSKGALKVPTAAVWEQSLESSGVFTHSMAKSLPSNTTVVNVEAVWKVYGGHRLGVSQLAVNVPHTPKILAKSLRGEMRPSAMW